MNLTTTVADLLVDRLIEWGVDTVFSLPGDGINGIFESLRQRQDRITMIQVRPAAMRNLRGVSASAWQLPVQAACIS